MPDLPPLTFSSLFSGRAFGPDPFPITTAMIDDYIAITGDNDPLWTAPGAARSAGFPGAVVPPGLTGVWARQAYLGRHRMLPGGVMAGQDIDLLGAALVGEPLMLDALITDVDPSDPKRKVRLKCSARSADGTVSGEVVIDARWPEGDGS